MEMTFVVHLSDLIENLPYVFHAAAFKYEKFPSIPPAVFLEPWGSGWYRKHFLNRTCMYAKNAQYWLQFNYDFAQIGFNMVLNFSSDG